MSAQYNITINKHSDFSRSFAIKEDGLTLDLTGFTFAAQMRENYTESTAVDFTLTVVDPVSGLINMVLTDDTTATLDPGTWVWDLVMIGPAGDRTRLMEGKAFVKQGATR